METEPTEVLLELIGLMEELGKPKESVLKKLGFSIGKKYDNAISNKIIKFEYEEITSMWHRDDHFEIQLKIDGERGDWVEVLDCYHRHESGKTAYRIHVFKEGRWTQYLISKLNDLLDMKKEYQMQLETSKKEKEIYNFNPIDDDHLFKKKLNDE